MTRWGILVSLLLLLSLISYGFFISNKIEKRFSARRWSIPSTVYSDTTILHPGQRVNVPSLINKLVHLGYRKINAKPAAKGEMRISSNFIHVYLNDLRKPSQTREGFPVDIRLAGGRIKAIKRFDSPELLPILELEPEEIMQFYGRKRERRQVVDFNEIPAYLVHSVLAAEDNRFFEHHGFDPIGMIRAFLINIRHGSIRQGGSTITQQLAKNYFLTPDRNISRKLNELVIAVVMELMYDKNEILEIYLNEIYLGQKGSTSINGIGEAANFYFGKSISDLTLPECALIAGLIRAPNYYSPYVSEKRCRERRNQVLKTMEEKGWISKADQKKFRQEPVRPVGFVPQDRQAPYFMDYLSRQLQTVYSSDTLESQGLSIYTTLDTQVQSAAENALRRGLLRLEKSNPGLKRKDPAQKLQGAIIVMQPKTGYILAMVGGRDYRESQFNRIDQSRRQPGSAFKPFVYLAALDLHLPSTLLSNSPRTYTVNGKPWEPKNFSEIGENPVTMRTALEKSYNLATVDLAMKTGLEKIVTQANRFSFSTPIQPYPSLALGAFEVIPLELARAYCVFAANGVMPYPLSLKEVANEKGNILKQTHLSVERLISPAKAFIVTSMLKSVVTGGTARALKHLGINGPVAGKTGTTNNYRDALFLGYTPNILALVWVGFDNGDPVHSTGSGAALPIWADLMTAIPQYLSEGDFKIPPGVKKMAVCRDSHLPAIEGGCPRQYDEYFLEDQTPGASCKIHKKTGIIKRFIRRLKKFVE